MDIRDQVAKKVGELDAREHVRNVKKLATEMVAALQTADKQIEELTGAVATMTTPGMGQGGQKNWGRGGSGGRGGWRDHSSGGGCPAGFKSPYICWCHHKFGENAGMGQETGQPGGSSRGGHFLFWRTWPPFTPGR